MARIYVASSWNNQHYQFIVSCLRQVGHEVYDFRNPRKGTNGSGRTRLANDLEAMDWADTCVLVLPCSGSASAKAGWMAGRGKKTIVYIPKEQECELTRQLFDLVTDNVHDILAYLQNPEREFLHMWPDYGDALFWDLHGVNVGFPDVVFLKDGTGIDLTGVKGLSEWFYEWDEESTQRKSGWNDSDWIAWRQRGYELAKQVRKLLPAHVDFYYMWKSKKVWNYKPDDLGCGGCFAGESPMLVTEQ